MNRDKVMEIIKEVVDTDYTGRRYWFTLHCKKPIEGLQHRTRNGGKNRKKK